MAFASAAPRTFAFNALPIFKFNAKFSLWRMVRDALSQAREVQANSDIEHYLESTGGKLTDEGEREIMRRLLNNSSSRW